MAEIVEISDRNMSKAIDCYSKSFDLDTTDTKLLLKSKIFIIKFTTIKYWIYVFNFKVCSCYLNSKDKFDSTSASKWLEKAEQAFPYDQQVLELKERLFNILESNTQNNDWEMFLLKGLVIKFQARKLL